MTHASRGRRTILMMAYSHYESDPRVIREAEAAVEEGFEVDFLALRKPGTLPVETIRGVRVIRLNQTKYRGGGRGRYILGYLNFFLKCLVKTTGLFVKRRYQLIHVNNMPDFLVFSSVIPKLFGAKVILDIHDPMPNTFASKFKGREGGFYYRALLWQERLSAWYSDQVITVHHPVRDGILTKHGLRQDSIEIVANFPDEELFPLRESSGAEGKIRFAFHGTILERSGLRTLMTALAGVRHKDRVSVKIIGEGDFSEALKWMIASLNLGGMVEFDNHTYPAHQIAREISDCNAGIVPLEISSVTNYALPLKLVEYISMGLPVVTVRNDAIAYYLTDDDCIFFERNDPSSLSAVLDHIAENPEILEHYRNRSVALRGRFSWTGEKKKYMDLLNRLAGVSGSAPWDAKGAVRKSAGEVAGWVEEQDYRGYDPGDGDLSFLRYLTFNIHFLRRLLTAATLRAPFHIRPWIGIRPHTSTKGMGYMGWGYTRMYALTGDEDLRRRAEFCFGWLIENRSPGYAQYCWGNHFAFSTRAGTTPRLTPIIVWTSLIGLAFLEAYEVFNNSQYLDAAASAAEWVKRLPREATRQGTCISYVPFEKRSIHNSNLLGAALLARVAAHTNDRESLDAAREAVVYSCARQLADGAWYYGEAAKYRWIDNFHTGYNLDCLKRYIDSTGDREFEPHLRLGLEYFKRHFFEADSRPKYYHNKTYPTDIQCAAQAIDTLAFFADRDPNSLELAVKVARWTIENMQSRDGHFYYRDLGWKKIKTPMLHWGQGTMFKALAELLSRLEGEGKWSSQSSIGVLSDPVATA